VDHPPNAGGKSDEYEGTKDTGDGAGPNEKSVLKRHTQPEQNDGQEMKGRMAAEQGFRCQLAWTWRFDAGAGRVHGAEERQNALQDTEKKGQKPAKQYEGHLEKCLCEIKVALLLYSGLMIFGLRSSLSV